MTTYIVHLILIEIFLQKVRQMKKTKPNIVQCQLKYYECKHRQAIYTELKGH